MWGKMWGNSKIVKQKIPQNQQIKRDFRTRGGT